MTDRPPLWPLACCALVGLVVALRVWWLGHGIPAALVAGMLTYCGLVVAPVLGLLLVAAAFLFVAAIVLLVRR